MEARNPYATPKAPVDLPDTGVGTVRLWSRRGRLGRLRYMAWSFVAGIVTAVPGVLAGVLGAAADGAGASMAFLVALVPIAVFMVLLSIQRVHDFNASGWWALIAILPLVSLALWFVPGSAGSNRFGPRPPPNGPGVVVAGLALPILFVLGIVFAVALPAYQDYVVAAEAARAAQEPGAAESADAAPTD